MTNPVLLAAQALVETGDLAPADAGAAFDAILEGGVDDVTIAAFLIALRMRGESPDIIVAGAQALRAKARMLSGFSDAIDTCGTGGDGANTVNISTCAAIIAAAGGAKVAKHGNRAVSSKSGSSDVLAALGVNLDASEAQHQAALQQANITFLFAPAHHSAMRHVASARKTLRLRTVFNLLGPLANPAGVRRQVLGVYDAAWVAPMAETLLKLGCERALVVHGQGLDELTTSGPSTVAEVINGGIRLYEVTPEAVGLDRAPIEALVGGDATQNAAALKSVLDGARGAYRDIACLNAGAALLVAGEAGDLAEGVVQAIAAIDDGRAAATLQALVKATNR